MSRIRGSREAFGRPGIQPRWTQGGKDGVGTAYSADSRIWFTLWNGCVTEVYYPTLDRPQIRDLQYLVSDGVTFFNDEKKDLETVTTRLSPHELGYCITNSDPEGRYRIVKDIVAAPHLPCLLQHTRLEGDRSVTASIQLYALLAPHLQVGGWGNNGYVLDVAGKSILVAEKGGLWLAMAATVPFSRLSAGYVGASDGWTDLSQHLRMDWEFDRAEGGNIALTGQLELGGKTEFTLGLAFGDGLHHAVTSLFQALGVPFVRQRKRFTDQWDRPCKTLLPLETSSEDGGNLYHGSCSLLLAHEDKTFPGALIASLSIPWGESRGDEDVGGYHLVWTRDMVNSAMGLMAAGNYDTPLRALIYLAATQQEDGGFAQNFWLDGTPHWKGIQLDEVAFPILLAWHLREEGRLGEFDPGAMIRRAAAYLVRQGPSTQQERWEEAAGYSPSTLAACIAGLICAASFLRRGGEEPAARFLEEYADFLVDHLEDWTVTTRGSLLPGVERHYVRILPVRIDDVRPDENPDRHDLALANQPPGSRWRFPAREIVDAGFLELVRYGVCRADDPTIVDSLRVVDAVLRVETPYGPCWRRYNHDGYGQRDDGGPCEGWGRGRAWPLLTGERAHYELAAGREVRHLVRAMEGFASPTGLLPEQVWDAPEIPGHHLYPGRPTGAAMPLMWAHAEYVKLLRSLHDRKVFDLIPDVAARYSGKPPGRRLEIWKPNRQVARLKPGTVLRIQAPAQFRLRWSSDEWRTSVDVESQRTGLGIEYVDLAPLPGQKAPFRFTFHWSRPDRWEGRDFEVALV